MRNKKLEALIKLCFFKTAGDKPNDLKFKIVELYCTMHSGEKAQLEKALDAFVQLETSYVNTI